MTIVLQEALRGLFYAPYYAMLALGAADRDGIEIRFVSSPAPAEAPLRVLDGTVDVSWGGPMRVNRMHEERPGCDLVCFGEAVTRDPFFLIGREAKPQFQFADLFGVRLATVAEVPTPWLCLQKDLRRIGLDPDQLSPVRDRGMAENAAALRRGELDVVQLFQPFAEELLADGTGHMWYAAAARGPTSYTSFYARRPVVASRRDEFKGLMRALYRAQRWLYGNPVEALAELVQPYFAEVSAPLLRSALTRYRELGVWGRDPILPHAGYERLRAGLVSGGFVRSGAPFETAVDNSLAEEVLREPA